MNYRHHFHAGNFADVFKHVILSCVLEKLQQKATPLTYLDTHAGRGLYYLNSSDTQKLKEYQFGIQALLSYATTHPAPEQIQHYIDVVGLGFTSVQHNMIYPGSPRIAESLMREQDKMILCELHPEEFAYLRQNMRRVSSHCIDAYAAMKAFLPPKTPRGVVMIDPPFEKRNEFTLIEAAVAEALKRWRMGQFLIWYPIKDKKAVEKFQRNLKSRTSELFFVDFFIKNQEISSNLMGCGMGLINPPWKLREMLENSILPYLGLSLSAQWEII